PGDYDNVGHDEFAIFRPSTSQWFINGPNGLTTVRFGGPQDVPVPGVYDTPAAGRKFEVAVFRPSTGQYFIRGAGGNRTVQFAATETPAPGDYNGDGLTDPTVYRQTTLQWLTAGPADTVGRVFTAFGGPKDIPVVSPYRYRALSFGGVSSLAARSAG